jgi:hypothetical protein
MIRPLGLVNTVNATTPVQVTVGLLSQAQKNIPSQSVLFQAAPGNTKPVYIGVGSAEDSSPPIDNVEAVAVLAAPLDVDTGPFDRIVLSVPNIPAGLNAPVFFIWGDAANGVYVSSLTQ